MSFGFGFALPAILRGAAGYDPFNQSGPTLDLSFAGAVTDLSDPNGYTLTTDFIVPQYQIAAQYSIWENGAGLVPKNFSDIITFTRASSATYFDSAGVLQTATTNVPRFDYNPSTLAARGLLIEEARTNLWSYSDDFGNAAWSKGGATVSTDTTTAPTGTSIADSLIENSSTGQHRAFRTVSGTTNTNPYTVSFFAKANTRTRVYVGIVESPTFSRQGSAVFDLSAGTIVSVGSGSNGATGGSATITNVGNGWYRCTYTLTLGGTDTAIFSDINLVSTGTTISYTGDGTSGLYLFGAQLEAGAFPTSYIPTVASTVTRAADIASVNTVSPWYNATEGSLYTESQQLVAQTAVIFPRIVVVDNGSTTNALLHLWRTDTSRLYANGVSSGSSQYDLGVNGVTQTSVNKIASAFAANNFAASVNGGPVLTDLAGVVPSGLTTLRIGRSSGTDYLNGYIRRITYYPRRLSNTELQAITA